MLDGAKGDPSDFQVRRIPAVLSSALNVMSTIYAPIRGHAPRIWSRTLALALLLGLVSCTTQAVPRPVSSDMAGMAPSLSVELFLQAVNARDYETMSSLFGTAEGPIQGNRTDLEIRMDLMAQVLAHEDYRLASQSAVPGRQTQTTRVGVDLTIGRRLIPNVEFLVVRSAGDRWLIEQIDLEAVTGG